MKDYNYNYHNGRYGSGSVIDESDQYNFQWGNSYRLEKGNISAGVDYQRQSIEPGGYTMTSKKKPSITQVFILQDNMHSSTLSMRKGQYVQITILNLTGTRHGNQV